MKIPFYASVQRTYIATLNQSFVMNGETGDIPVTSRSFPEIIQFSYAIGINCRRMDKALGGVWMGEEIPDMFSEQYVSIIAEIKARNALPNEEVCLGERDVQLPPTLVMLKDDAKLPEWKPEKGCIPPSGASEDLNKMHWCSRPVFINRRAIYNL